MSYKETIKGIIFEALGEASALFMSQECRGVDIVMPDIELKRIGLETHEKILSFIKLGLNDGN